MKLNEMHLNLYSARASVSCDTLDTKQESTGKLTTRMNEKPMTRRMNRLPFTRDGTSY
ncbi:hypothetical protein BVRB_7g172090 [Beta vulgaris subsp. vulgaris]|nr:hypothetical protein BVRB_7g172090 [Beta vulgaris subsp. vulgaris]